MPKPTPIVEPQRVERDPIGEFQVPQRALYGIQTARALDTFRISSHRLHPGLIRAYVEIKKAAALANIAAGALDERRGHAIVSAADEVIEGRWLEHFPLDAFQAGAGTSTNMNVNEVLANRALELLDYGRGDYSQLHPNDHVDRLQSTNDTMPTAIRVASLRLLHALLAAIDGLVAAFEAKAAEWAEVRKAGRTHLHDATPMTLGQEFARLRGQRPPRRRPFAGHRGAAWRSAARRNRDRHRHQHGARLCRPRRRPPRRHHRTGAARGAGSASRRNRASATSSHCQARCAGLPSS